MPTFAQLLEYFMKCLVFSDSHGKFLSMRNAIIKNLDAEVIFFLGDGISDAEMLAAEFCDKFWICVRGNCDFCSTFRGREVDKVESITLLGKRIVLTHGDLYDVKYSTDRIQYLALSREADILLFGHTHRPFEKYVSDGEHPYYLFNPGAVSGYDASFGILTLSESMPPFFSHGEL